MYLVYLLCISTTFVLPLIVPQFPQNRISEQLCVSKIGRLIHGTYTRTFAENLSTAVDDGGTIKHIDESGDNVALEAKIRPNEGALLLNKPQLLVRFRVPKGKTSFKSELEELQSTYGPRSGSSRQEGQQNSRDPFLSQLSSERVKPALTDSGFIPSYAEYPSSDAGRKGSMRSKGGNRDGERKGSEGARPRDQSSTRRNSGFHAELDSSYDSSYTSYDDREYDSSDYYGEEVRAGLSSISSGELASMNAQGLSLEEMQMAIYGEYGIKVTSSAIRRRLQDDKFPRNTKSKKKTGKTRRDRNKARNARRFPAEENYVDLPSGGVIQVAELAEKMEIGVGELLKHLMMNEGVMVTMNQSIDVQLARKAVEAFGKKLLESSDEEEDALENEDDDGSDAAILDEQSITRSPIVTIMGHVDHGKTTLLDKIRDSRVALGEAGGITQGISAFKVQTSSNQQVTFFDTPGHAAFSEMRSRGASLTDLVILVVAADDGVMEQTKECIAAAQAAGCPIVVAINKIDKEGANVEKVKTDLMSYGVLLEEFGGEVQCVQISAKKGTGIEELLEKTLLQAEIMNLRAIPEASASGAVIEAHMDKGLGVVVTALVQQGTLHVGDLVLAGPSWGRVRALLSDQGVAIDKAGPSTPVQISGMNGIPNAGDTFSIASTDAMAKEVAEARQRLEKQAISSVSNAAIVAQASGMASGMSDSREVLKIPLLIKADTLGSVEALIGSINQLQREDESALCLADVVFSGVGEVTSSDVSIAAAAKAKIVAFGVAAGFNAMEEARSSNIDIGYYNIVYELLEELKTEIETTLAPPPPGELLGRAEVKKVFKLGKAGKVAGSEVSEGLIRMDSKVRVLRGKRNVIYSGSISGLKVVKDDVREVPSGSECGISFKEFSDIEEGDIIECFSIGSESYQQ